MIIEKIDPIIDKPAPLNNLWMVLTSPSLKPETESRTDLESLVAEVVAEIIAEIEKPNITRQSNIINVTIEAIKYFCCLGAVDPFTICFINFSVKPAVTSSS